MVGFTAIGLEPITVTLFVCLLERTSNRENGSEEKNESRPIFVSCVAEVRSALLIGSPSSENILSLLGKASPTSFTSADLYWNMILIH